MTTTTTIAANAGTSTSILAHQLGFLPPVRHFDLDGAPCVAVALSGLHGVGRQMILDEADWRHISETISPWWQVVRVGSSEYVACSNSTAIEIARRTSKVRMLSLSRYLADPAPGLMVRFVNGNHLDCRRCNLVIVTRREHGQANGAAIRMKALKRHAEQCAAMAAANEAEAATGDRGAA